MGRRVLKFDGPSGRGLWIALRAILIKSALRDWLSVSYGMIRILVIGSLRSPPPLSGCARVQRVQKVQRVQRVVVAPFGRNHHTWRRTSPVVSGQRSADSGQRTADSSQPSANACYPAKGTLKGISIQNTHASMTWFSKSAAGVIVEGAGRKDVSFPIISFEEAYYGELQSL